MTALDLHADKREVLGKKTRFLRRQNIVPTHLFGHGIKSQALQCQNDELSKVIKQAGMTRIINLHVGAEKQPKKVFIREIQRDCLSGDLLHVDLYNIRMTEKMTAEIPIVLVGEAPAMKEKSRIVAQSLSHLSVECLPDKLPPQIEVDLSPLEELGQALHVSDIKLVSSITILTDSENLIVKINEVAAAKVEEEEITEEEGAAEEEATTEEAGTAGEEAPAEEDKS